MGELFGAGGVRATRARLVTVTVDQVVASACAYVLVLLVARSASPSEFGVFVIGFGIITVAAAIGRSAFGAVLGMDLPTLDQAAAHELSRRSAAAVLLLGLPPSLALGVVAVAVDGSISHTMWVLAAALPALMLQDLVRFDLVARGRPQHALRAELIWLAPPLLLLVTDLVRDRASSPALAGLLWLGGLIGSLVTLALSGRVPTPRFAGIRSWVISDPRRFHLGADATMSGLAPVGNGIGAAAVASAAATAAVRGAAAIFAPLATLFLAMSIGAVPEARRRDARSALRLLGLLTALLVGVAILWGAIMLFLPDSIGTEILGETWATAEPLIPYLALEYVGLALWSGGTAMLRLANETRLALTFRLVYAPATLVLPVLALWLSDDVRWFAATLAGLGLAVGAIGLLTGVHRVRNSAIVGRQESTT